MFDTRDTKALLGPADPARGMRVPPPRATATEVIALAQTITHRDLPSGVRRRRILVPVAAGVAAAGLVATGLVATSLVGGRPSGGSGATGSPAASRPAEATVTLGPVVRPVAFQFAKQPPAAGDRLRALAAQLGPSRCDTTSGKYTFIRTIGWNAVFDDSPDGKSQRIVPSDKRLWYAADGSGRIRSIDLPAVYPNEESRRYWERHPVGSTTTPRADVDDLPAGQAGPSKPLPTDPAELAKRIDTGDPFRSVHDLSGFYAVPLAARAELLRILANTPGVVWRGETTDRAGRTGVAISVDTPEAQQVLIFDPRTGELLAWDEVERPTDTVAGSTLIMSCEHTDQLG
jgi:hypothetical protein